MGAEIRYNEIPEAFMARISFLLERVEIENNTEIIINIGRKDFMTQPEK